MPDKTANFTPLKIEGTAEKVGLYRGHLINTNDTVDVGPSGKNDFGSVKAAVYILPDVPATVSQATITGTVLTIAAASIVNQAVYLMVLGDSAT